MLTPARRPSTAAPCSKPSDGDDDGMWWRNSGRRRNRLTLRVVSVQCYPRNPRRRAWAARLGGTDYCHAVRLVAVVGRSSCSASNNAIGGPACYASSAVRVIPEWRHRAERGGDGRRGGRALRRRARRSPRGSVRPEGRRGRRTRLRGSRGAPRDVRPQQNDGRGRRQLELERGCRADRQQQPAGDADARAARRRLHERGGRDVLRRARARRGDVRAQGRGGGGALVRASRRFLFSEWFSPPDPDVARPPDRSSARSCASCATRRRRAWSICA